MVKIRNNLLNNKGMTLIEVIIAAMLFSVFILAFMQGQGANVLSSVRVKQELMLKDLAELKINELMLDPPEFKETLSETNPETKAFDDFPEYTHTVIIKKMFIPDLSKITGESEEEDAETEQSPQSQIEKKIFEITKKNIEKLVWQISVIITNKESGDKFEISGWVPNHKAKVEISGF